jgi:hypothetical protein
MYMTPLVLLLLDTGSPGRLPITQWLLIQEVLLAEK